MFLILYFVHTIGSGNMLKCGREGLFQMGALGDTALAGYLSLVKPTFQALIVVDIDGVRG